MLSSCKDNEKNLFLHLTAHMINNKVMHWSLRIFWYIYLIVIYLPIGIPVTVLTAVITWLGCKLGNHRIWSYYPGMVWSRIMIAITCCPYRVEGLEHLQKGQSYVLVANHASIYDVFAIYGWIGRPFKWIMKKELRNLPFIGKACEEAGFIYINQKGGKQAVNCINEAEEKIKGGVSIAIFPEGSRTRNGQTGPFKRGAFEIARTMQLPVVPISLSGCYQVMPRNAFYPLPHRIKMVIHPPVEFNPQTPDEERSQIARIRETVIEGIDSAYAK